MAQKLLPVLFILPQLVQVITPAPAAPAEGAAAIGSSLRAAAARTGGGALGREGGGAGAASLGGDIGGAAGLEGDGGAAAGAL